MKYWFKPEKEILMEELFDGRLEAHGIAESIVPGLTSPTDRWLEDSNGYVQVSGETYVGLFTCRSGFHHIIHVVSKMYDTKMYEEYDPEFWGYASREEMDSARALEREVERVRYVDEIVNYVLGEKNEVSPQSCQEVTAKLVGLIANMCPGILTLKDGDRLREAIESVDNLLRENRVSVDDSDPFSFFL